MNLHRLIYFLATPFTIQALKNIRPTKYLVPLTGHANFLSRTYASSSKNDIPKQKNLAPKYVPKTANQQTYAKHLNNPDTSIVLGIGPAGCGKTHLVSIARATSIGRISAHIIRCAST